MKTGGLCTLFCLLTILARPLAAQDSLDTKRGTPEAVTGTLQIARSSLGLRAGYGATPGVWAKSPVVPSVKLYGEGFTYEGDLEFRIAPLWTLGFGGGYVALDGSAWQKYARNQGDVITIELWSAHAEVTLRPHIRLGEWSVLRVEVGAAALFAGGSEEFAGTEYAYEELPEYAFGGILGLEYQHEVAESFALTIGGKLMVFPGALESVTGTNRTILLVPVTAGIRVLL